MNYDHDYEGAEYEEDLLNALNQQIAICEDYKAEHRRYLRSKRWKELREQRLKMDNYTCQECGRKPPKRYLQVHHLSYENKGKPEEINDLLTLCARCHMKEEGITPR